jgi:phenylacetate-CoA ligase
MAPQHSDDHWTRLRDEVARMIAEVPLYAGRPAAPASASPAVLSDWLAGMPTVQKRDLRRGFPKSLVRRSTDLKAALASGEVEILATSGTTESRLQILWDWGWWDPQEREAMRLNQQVAQVMPVGADYFREAVLTTPVCGAATCHVGTRSRAERTIDGMLFLNQVADPTHWTEAELERMIVEWNDLRPDGVEADPIYLAALCRHAVARSVALHPPSFVTLTYEQITRAAKRAISRALPATPLLSLYGATEAGVLFMECTAGRLHHNSRHSHIELLPVAAGAAPLGRVVVTTLGRTWMPLLRYDIGDLVRVVTGPCTCGQPEDGYLLERVEGRVNDALVTADRTLLSPAALDDIVDGDDDTLAQWQLCARDDGAGFLLRVVTTGSGDHGRAAAARLSQRLGVPVEPRLEAAILPEGSGKYRLVRK